MKPIYQITIDGGDITQNIEGKLISLTLTDNRAFEADQLTLAISDADGSLALPRRGAVATVALGFEIDGKRNLIDKGNYTVDDVQHSGAPDQITITARSVNFREGFKTERTKTWKEQTIGDIVNAIAGRHKLTGQIADNLASITIDHIHQNNESDGHFLTRLAARYDALLNIKSDNLLFMPQGQGVSVTGANLPTVTIDRSETTSHTYRAVDRKSKYTGVKAKWRDTDMGKTMIELAGDKETTKRLKAFYPTQAEAKAVADAEWQRIQRSQASMQISLAVGRPEMLTETPVELVGWGKGGIDGDKWIVKKVDHQLNDSGLTSLIQLQIKS